LTCRTVITIASPNRNMTGEYNLWPPIHHTDRLAQTLSSIPRLKIRSQHLPPPLHTSETSRMMRYTSCPALGKEAHRHQQNKGKLIGMDFSLELPEFINDTSNRLHMSTLRCLSYTLSDIQDLKDAVDNAVSGALSQPQIPGPCSQSTHSQRPKQCCCVQQITREP
jgi:hypothetical protein